MLVNSGRQIGGIGSPSRSLPKQVLVINATEREVNTILTTLSPRQRTEVLLTATNIVKNMFIDPVRQN
jgi:hypothetical protein